MTIVTSHRLSAPLIGIGALAVLALGACSAAGTPATPTEPAPTTIGAPGDTPGSSTPSASPEERGRVITYTGESEGLGVVITKPADVAKLEGAPQSFKDFVAAESARPSECEFGRSIEVDKIDTNGFALGGVTECGGYVAIWKLADGQWKEILGTQDLWTCQELGQHQVPSSIAGPDCLDADTRKIEPYNQD